MKRVMFINILLSSLSCAILFLDMAIPGQDLNDMMK